MTRGRAALALLALALVGPAVALLVPSKLGHSLLAQATMYAIYALGVGVLLRQNGMVSFGHAAFFGFPGYFAGALLPLGILPAEVVVVAAIGITALVAFLVGLVIVRVHGIAFGMLTLAIGQAVYEAATRLRGLTGGHDGLSIEFPRVMFGMPARLFGDPKTMLLISWLAMVAVLAFVMWFAASRHGRLAEAIRDNEERARFVGYDTLVPRAMVFALSAAVTAVGGMLFALYNAFISPETVHWTASGAALVMAILGGAAAPWGPLLGGYVYFFLKEAVGSYTTHWLGIVGACLILITVAFPAGLSGLLLRLRPRADASAASAVREVPDARP